MEELNTSASRLRQVVDSASKGLVEREILVELAALGAVAGEHLLVIGPPGTAKSQAIRRFAEGFDGHYFEYLLGRFTEPSEIFGPVDLRKLQDGLVETATEGMLPEAEIAFLDEVFQGSTAILNTLLGLLNERRFRRGHTTLDSPLRLAVGASNALPEDPLLAAFADRFLLHHFVEPVPDSRLEDLLEGGWQSGVDERPGAAASIEDLAVLHRAMLAADPSGVRPILAEALRLLRGAGVHLSDRRAVRCQRLIAAAAVIDGRPSPSGRDLWPLLYAIPQAETQQLARETLRDLLAESANETLGAASEDASHGPAARAERLLRASRECLEQRPDASEDGVDPDQTGWSLRAEGLLREIDAGFSAESMPENLAEVRAELVGAVESS